MNVSIIQTKQLRKIKNFNCNSTRKYIVFISYYFYLQMRTRWTQTHKEVAIKRRDTLSRTVKKFILWKNTRWTDWKVKHSWIRNAQITVTGYAGTDSTELILFSPHHDLIVIIAVGTSFVLSARRIELLSSSQNGQNRFYRR